MKILIACHAGAGLGLGHLTRALMAAKALQDGAGASVTLLVQGDSVNRPDLQAFEHCFASLDQSLSALIAQAHQASAFDLVLLDLQPRQVPDDLGRLIDALHETGCKVVAIDGLLEYRPTLDLIFIPSFQFVPPSNLKGGAPIVFGWDCLLLNVPTPSTDWQAGPRVLALTGGSDATQLGQTWPTLLDKVLPDGAELHWVTGPFSSPPCMPEASRIAIHAHQAPAGLGSLMQSSNQAATVFGVSFFELLYLGIPSVVFSPYGDKDQRELDQIAKAGIALVARDEVEASGLLVDLMKDDQAARQLSMRSRALLKQPGAAKLCDEIANIMKR